MSDTPSPSSSTEKTIGVTNAQLCRLWTFTYISLGLNVLILAAFLVGAILHHHGPDQQRGWRGPGFQHFGGMGPGWGRPGGFDGNRPWDMGSRGNGFDGQCPISMGGGPGMRGGWGGNRGMMGGGGPGMPGMMGGYGMPGMGMPGMMGGMPGMMPGPQEGATSGSASLTPNPIKGHAHCVKGVAKSNHLQRSPC